MSGLAHPSRKVEWSDKNYSTWNNVSDDVLGFTIRRGDLTYGPWTIEVLLDNKEGKYSKNVFPPIGAEAGLYYFLRAYINNTIRGMFRIFQPAPEFGWEHGDALLLQGLGMGQEAVRRKASPKNYNAWKADDIINDQFALLSPSDISFTSPSSAPRTYSIIPKSGTPTLKDVVVDLAENIEYVAYFQSTEKPVPLQFFSKADSAKQLNVVLRSVLRNQTNNVGKGRDPRNIYSLANYLTLEQYRGEDSYFRTEVPQDMDGFTEEPDVLAACWFVVVGTLSMDGVSYYEGKRSIKCVATMTTSPQCYLQFPDSPYGGLFLQQYEECDRLDFYHKEASGCQTQMAPRIILIDNDGYQIYQDITFSSSWAGKSCNIGSVHIGEWSGDTANFTWEIKDIMFQDMADHSSDAYGTPTLWIDGLYFFENGAYQQFYLKDQTSIDTFGQSEEQLPLPASFPFINVYRWGLQKLDRLRNPLRMLSLSDIQLDPAQVMEDDEVTPADFFPGWSVQVEIPRFKIQTVTNGGVWWRILQATEYWNRVQGYSIDMDLVPTSSESPEDYSSISDERILQALDPYMGRIHGLARKERARAARLGLNI